MNTIREEQLLKNDMAQSGSLLLDVIDVVARLTAVGYSNNDNVSYKAIQTAFLNLFITHLSKDDFNIKEYLDLQEKLVNKYIHIIEGKNA